MLQVTDESLWRRVLGWLQNLCLYMSHASASSLVASSGFLAAAICQEVVAARQSHGANSGSLHMQVTLHIYIVEGPANKILFCLGLAYHTINSMHVVRHANFDVVQVSVCCDHDLGLPA